MSRQEIFPKPKALIVEADPDIIEVFRGMVGDAADVFSTYDFIKAKQAVLANHNIEVAVVDARVSVPQEACRFIREIKALGRRIFIIGTSVYATDFPEMVKSGCDLTLVEKFRAGDRTVHALMAL